MMIGIWRKYEIKKVYSVKNYQHSDNLMCKKKNQLIGIKIRMNKSIQLNSKLSDHFFIGYRAH